METWISRYKEKLVKAWVDKHLHFENVVTSRCEGIHSLIKDYLNTSQLDLFEAWRSIKLALQNQLAQLQANQAQQRIRTPLELSGSLYGSIRGWVSHEALRKVDFQRKRLQHELPSCTGVFSRSLGLPCAHVLKPLVQQNQHLQLSHFHKHWYLQRSGIPQPILEPCRQVDRVTVSSTIQKTSTRRIPSAFEAVEASSRSKAPPRCSRCQLQGHIKSSKHCPQRYDDLKAVALVSAQPMAHPVVQETAVIVSQQPMIEVAQEAAIAPAVVQEPLLDADAQELMDRELADKAIADMLNEALCSDDDSCSGQEHDIDNTRSLEKAPEPLPYSHPLSIYQRYTLARDAWYESLSPGSQKTDRLYRKA